MKMAKNYDDSTVWKDYLNIVLLFVSSRILTPFIR